MSVQLLDITAAGMLLQAPEPVERGTPGSLSLSLDGMPLKAGVRVERLAVAERSGGYRVGATFVGLTPDQRRLIERFMTS